MSWNEDFNMLLEKKSEPKQGRRSGTRLGLDSPDELPESRSNDASPGSNPIRARKTGVWSDEIPKSSKMRSGPNIIEIKRFQNNSIVSEDDDIPVIPDIDDVLDDPTNISEVKPIITVNKTTYKELDNQLNKLHDEKFNFGNVGDVDLAFLTNKLYSEKDVQLDDSVWTIESLHEDIARYAGGT